MRKRSIVLSAPALLTAAMAVLLFTACDRTGGDAGVDSTSVAGSSTGRVTLAAPAVMSAPTPDRGRPRSMGASVPLAAITTMSRASPAVGDGWVQETPSGASE